MSIVEEAIGLCYEGMSEDDGHKILDELMGKHDVEKKWHPSKFRIGINTTKSFRDISEESVTLEDGDLVFIDIGPVVDDHEGDFGKTFVFGKNDSRSKIISDLDAIFEKVKLKWERENLTGIDLYRYASQIVDDYGYILNDRMKGHRIGDFPHHLFYRGGLNEFDECPKSGLWILELHILSSDQTYGAFFEDILERS
jgi:Xaa-Pro aminopeptidase